MAGTLESLEEDNHRKHILGQYLLADPTYALDVVRQKLIRYAQSLCDTIWFGAVPIILSPENDKLESRKKEQLRRFYTSLGFHPLNEEDDDEFIWTRGS